MCGIVGLYNQNGDKVSPDLLKKMTDMISYRGPDDQGHYVDGAVGLGHRRLSIIDLSDAGHQPMVDPKKNTVISYNGEIYNFKELRAQLEKEGVSFQSQSDTEVVLQSYLSGARIV